MKRSEFMKKIRETGPLSIKGARIKLHSGQTLFLPIRNARDFWRAARLTGRIGRYCDNATKKSKKLEARLCKINELYSQLFKEDVTSS